MVEAARSMDTMSLDVQGAAEMDVDAVLARLETSADGLGTAEAQQRLDRLGPNELAEEGENPLLKLLSFFWGPIPWMIEIAAVLSAVVGRWEDFAIIVVLLVANAGVGFWEEFRAGNAIAALRGHLARTTRVKRDGRWGQAAARLLVPGDIVRIRIGDIVPADVKFLTGEPAEVDQSVLTGESLPVTKEPGDVLYSGSTVQRGELDGVVVATGSDTYFGQTAHLLEEPETLSHFQRAVLKIGDYLIVIAIVLVAVIVGVAMFRGDGLLTTAQFALVLTVAAIPVAMPAVLSVTMAVGSHALANRQAIVSRLAAIEELAGMDVLCSDKTGTLTQNALTLGDPVTVGGATPEELLTAAALASRAEDGDPIDDAVLSGVPTGATDGCQVVGFHPFDPVSKRTEAEVVMPDGSRIVVSKGAPQVVLGLVDDRTAVQADLDRIVESFAARGFRALGVARKGPGDTWRLLGVLPLFDPPRADSAETLATAGAMGIDVKMVTGDQVAIAREIAGELHIGSTILDASVLEDSAGGERLDDTIEQTEGFAQVFPEHKHAIVTALQRRGHIVGMTGDGVNDAPALAKADVGIAVSGATDAARSAADIVLLTPGLSVIIDAIKESRKIFQRMRSYAIYRITETIRVLLFMTLSILVFDFYPVTAVMIVLLALLNDGAILSIAYDRVRYSDEPEVWDMGRVLGLATVLGAAGVVASFGLFYLAENIHELDRELIQSLMYLKLSVAGHLTIFVTRTEGPFWSIRPSRSLFLAVVTTQLLATLIAVYGVFMAPLGWGRAGLVWLYALAWFVVNDRIKLATQRMFESGSRPLLGRRRRHRRPDSGRIGHT